MFNEIPQDIFNIIYSYTFIKLALIYVNKATHAMSYELNLSRQHSIQYDGLSMLKWFLEIGCPKTPYLYMWADSECISYLEQQNVLKTSHPFIIKNILVKDDRIMELIDEGFPVDDHVCRCILKRGSIDIISRIKDVLPIDATEWVNSIDIIIMLMEMGFRVDQNSVMAAVDANNTTLVKFYYEMFPNLFSNLLGEIAAENDHMECLILLNDLGYVDCYAIIGAIRGNQQRALNWLINRYLPPANAYNACLRYCRFDFLELFAPVLPLDVCVWEGAIKNRDWNALQMLYDMGAPLEEIVMVFAVEAGNDVVEWFCEKGCPSGKRAEQAMRLLWGPHKQI
uniref:Ankyrin repeat protein n=1 Tax=Megaviridae environmental sample TaxID=1737588 RepID=A0A5J6VIZ2_9VIRU|nr:MAG: hypothetical protein [Megaviridae environmental sample]